MVVFASVLATIGTFVAGLGSQASVWVILDEPECPQNLIK